MKTSHMKFTLCLYLTATLIRFQCIIPNNFVLLMKATPIVGLASAVFLLFEFKNIIYKH